MVRSSISAEVVRLIAEAAKQGGQPPAWLGYLLSFVENRLKSTPGGGAALDLVQNQPDDKARQQVLADEVNRCAGADAEFAETLRTILQETKAQRKSYRGHVAANVRGDMSGTQEINTVVGENHVVGSGSARITVDRSKRRKITIWSLALSVAVGTTAVLLLPSITRTEVGKGGGGTGNGGGGGTSTSAPATTAPPESVDGNPDRIQNQGSGSGSGSRSGGGSGSGTGSGGGGSGSGGDSGGGGVSTAGSTTSSSKPVTDDRREALNQQVVTSDFTVGPGQGWDTVAACPAGKAPMGGGYFFGSDPGVTLDISRPATNQPGWHVHAINNSTQTHPITAYAICATVPTRQLVTSNFTVKPGEGWDTVAACPAGKAPTGGGHFFGSDPGVTLDISRPATNQSGWHVHAINNSTQTHPITAYAICADVPTRQLVTSNFTIRPGEGWDTVAACPSGKTPTGGGHFFGSDPGITLDISRPATNKSGWHVHAINNSAQTHTITAYAVCVSP
jgi:hypothetical protein